LLDINRAARTDIEGKFILDSERDLGLFQNGAWYSVTISFERDGYERFQTNYTPINVHISADGEPQVVTGDILLRPILK